MRSSILRLCAVFSVLILVGCGSNAKVSTSPTRVPEKGVTPCSSATSRLLALAPVTTLPPSPTFGPGLPLPFRSIHMLTPTSGWGITGGRVFRTTDGGTHWQDVTPSAAPEVTEIAAFLTSSLAWVVGKPPAGPLMVFKTTDSGLTWQPGGSLQNATPNQMLFVSPQEGWILADLGAPPTYYTAAILRTTDGGASWVKMASADGTAQNSAIPYGMKSGLGFLNASTGWLTGSAAPEENVFWLSVTHDGGASWQQQPLPMPPGVHNAQFYLSPPSFFNEHDGILPVMMFTTSTHVISLDIYVTHTGGTTWQSTTPVQANFPNFIDVAHGWVADGRTLFVTSDSGQHWAPLPTNSALCEVENLDFVSRAIGWAINAPPSALALPSLLKTTDGGQTWTVVKPLEGSSMPAD